MTTSEIKGNTILLLGYGRENQSVHRFFAANYPMAKIAIADQTPVLPLFPITKITSGPDYLLDIDQYETVVRSPGIPSHLTELIDYKLNGGRITTATNIFFSICPGTTIGVTGTKGKSTTSSLIAHILSDSRNKGAPILGISKQSKPDVRLVGNIGNPVLDALVGATADTVFVVELSSHQLEDVGYSPHIAVVLGVFPEHMDYYKNFDQYVTAKANIVAFQTEKNTVVYNDLNDVACAIAQKGRGKKIPVSSYKNIPLSETKLKGNDENIHAAIAVASIFGIPKKIILDSMKTFEPLSHRLEFVGKFNGIDFYNDSLATIPEATIHALTALGHDVATLIAGGFDRGLDFAKLGKFLAENKHLKTLILFPDTGEKIRQAILAADPMSHVSCLISQNMQDAVSLAYQHTPAGKICVLSPAAASYNLFKDYADRGGQFIEWVIKLGQKT